VHVFINYKQKHNPDHEFAVYLEKHLRAEKHRVFRDESGMIPSEEWAQRLEDEILKCDALIAIVSNASLKSKWCLNEVDLAQENKKRILPIVMEDIDKSLKFQTFNPRFMLTHWYCATGDFGKDANALADVLRDDAGQRYVGLLQSVCAQHGVKDSSDLLEVLMQTLCFAHLSVALGIDHPYSDGLAGIIGPARSVAESVAKLSRLTASMDVHNVANSLMDGPSDSSMQQAWFSRRFTCLADVLSQAIGIWDRQGAIRRQRILEQVARENRSAAQSGETQEPSS